MYFRLCKFLYPFPFYRFNLFLFGIGLLLSLIALFRGRIYLKGNLELDGLEAFLVGGFLFLYFGNYFVYAYVVKGKCK